MGDKLHIVLDIDDTLLKNIKNEVRDMIPNLNKFELAPNTKDKTFVLRPHVREFMKYLFRNHYVSIWTWSDYPYALRVANLLTDGHPEMFKDILAEEDADISSKLHKVDGKDMNYLWYDYNEKHITPETKAKLDQRNANIDKINAERVEEGGIAFNPAPKVPFTGYAHCNTILIDDADYNMEVPASKFNMIQIKPFGGHTTTHGTAGVVPEFDEKDRELQCMIGKLEELRDKAKSACKHPKLGEEFPIMKAGRRTRRHKRYIKKTRKFKKSRKARRS